jgi:hypothetical protein
MKLNQKGAASALVLGLVVVLAIIVSIIAVCGVSYISAYNAGNEAEKSISATFENNKVVLATYSQKVVEAAQVPDMMRDDLVKVAKTAMEARYGEEGSKAIFQAIKEQNPQVSEKLYIQLQQIIISGRSEFQTNQTRLLDQKRSYETQLGSFWRGTWMRIAGYPKINLADFKTVITENVGQAFKTGVENSPIQLRPKP